MRDSFLIFGPVIGEEEIAEVVDSLRWGWVGTGPKVQRFETMLTDSVGVPLCRCVSSGTAALFLAMRVLGVGPGDEVIVPAMTFVASANAVEQTGARPVLVDSERSGTGLLDLDAAEAAITPRTRALMSCTWPAGRLSGPRERDPRSPRTVRGGGRRARARSGVAWTPDWYSRQPDRVLVLRDQDVTTIEGGALATDDPEIAAEVERLALHGLSLGAWQRFSDTGFRHYEVVSRALGSI